MQTDMEKKNILCCVPPKWSRRSWWVLWYWDNPWMISWIKPNIDSLNQQFNSLLDTLHQIKDTNTFTVPFPENEWLDDFLFVRDSFISNQKDKIILSNFKYPERQKESSRMSEYLEWVLISHQIDRVIIKPTIDYCFEWWEFRYIPEQNLLICWKSRNTLAWIKFVQHEFNVPDENTIILEWKWYHLDTYFSIVTNDEWWLILGILADNMISENDKSKLITFLKKHWAVLHTVHESYWIWLDWKWCLATNTLQVWSSLIWAAYFDEATESMLQQLNISRYITPVSEYSKSWGAIHCITNQL